MQGWVQLIPGLPSTGLGQITLKYTVKGAPSLTATQSRGRIGDFLMVTISCPIELVGSSHTEITTRGNVMISVL